ncbi:unnamed protein product [Kuraishia capsulata CBS 1993]|uniref:Zn(2)-C6 fungal-type domain-containing protein n=1 Tax=Kuraishia capsulata CBS 1993 TaxID=1382522 RepID=W6MWB2_9ASCO|nr:uncharacterized protein KUCA_T00003117001 [Kuraishia capsulata CBS 1993]CDK27140.1 unnamed protein product [Kuraishia capsulata CBS 1993]
MPPTRTKRYTGCWTCKARAIKCDENKPSCINCRFSGNSCEGFGVKLSWQNNSKGRPQFDKTRSLVLNKWGECDLLNDSQVELFLSSIDSASRFITSDGKECRYGPFRVFSLKEPAKNFVDKKLKVMSLLGPHVGKDVESLLFDFWDHHLCKFMVPVNDEKINPYRMVMQTIQDHSIPSEVRNAVLHSVYATCSSFLAISKEHMQPGSWYQDIDFKEYWKVHKRKAMDHVSIAYLRKASYSPADLGLLAAAISFLLTIDIFHISEEWQIHFRGALSTLKTMNQLGYGTDAMDPSVYFAQLIKLTYLFSTLHIYQDDVCNKYISVVDLDCIQFDVIHETESLMYRNTGVTESMIRCLAEIVKYLQLGETIKSIHEIEMDIELCQPQQLFEGCESRNSLIVYHQSMMFHIAMKLLFMREVKNRSPFELQDLATNGIEHIKADNDITTGSNGFGLLWPFFVISCETTSASKQQILQSFLEPYKSYSGTSMQRATRIIYAVWEKRKNGGNVSWIDVVRELDPTILLS